MGMSFDKPVRHLREYLEVLGPLSRGEAVAFDGEVYQVHAGARPCQAATPFPILVAALGPQMLKVAGRRSPTARSRGAPGRRRSPRTSIPTITAAAEAAGRPAPRDRGCAPGVRDRRRRRARARAAKVFAVYGQLPSYRAMLDREGAAGPADVAIVGSAAEVTERIGALADIGVTDFAAVEFAADPDEAAATRDCVEASDQPSVDGTTAPPRGGRARRSRCPCRRRR